MCTHMYVCNRKLHHARNCTCNECMENISAHAACYIGIYLLTCMVCMYVCSLVEFDFVEFSRFRL